MIGSVARKIDGVEYTMRFNTAAMLACSKSNIEVVPWLSRAMGLNIALPELVTLVRHGLKAEHPDILDARIHMMIDHVGLGFMIEWVSKALEAAMEGPKPEPGEVLGE
jgi:hypothetical protein